MSLIRSNAAKIRALAAGYVPFDEAERILRATQKFPPAEDAAERMRRSRREFADDHGLAELATLAREGRLRRWMGWDIARPPEPTEPEDDDDASEA